MWYHPDNAPRTVTLYKLHLHILNASISKPTPEHIILQPDVCTLPSPWYWGNCKLYLLVALARFQPPHGPRHIPSQQMVTWSTLSVSHFKIRCHTVQSDWDHLYQWFCLYCNQWDINNTDYRHPYSLWIYTLVRNNMTPNPAYFPSTSLKHLSNSTNQNWSYHFRCDRLHW